MGPRPPSCTESCPSSLLEEKRAYIAEHFDLAHLWAQDCCHLLQSLPFTDASVHSCLQRQRPLPQRQRRQRPLPLASPPSNPFPSPWGLRVCMCGTLKALGVYSASTYRTSNAFCMHACCSLLLLFVVLCCLLFVLCCCFACLLGSVVIWLNKRTSLASQTCLPLTSSRSSSRLADGPHWPLSRRSPSVTLAPAEGRAGGQGQGPRQGQVRRGAHPPLRLRHDLRPNVGGELCGPQRPRGSQNKQNKTKRTKQTYKQTTKSNKKQTHGNNCNRAS